MGKYKILWSDMHSNLHHEKIEEQDAASDLILYDVEKDEVQIIANDKSEFETFPYWRR